MLFVFMTKSNCHQLCYFVFKTKSDCNIFISFLFLYLDLE